jgi:hypothetical protein
MATQAFVDTFAVSTGLGSTTVRTGYGHAPKAIILWGGVSASAIDVVQSLEGIFSIGFATGPTSRRVISYRSVGGSAAGDSAAGSRNTAIAELIGTDGNSASLMDVSSFDADGWTAITDDDYATGRRYTALSVGGDDVTNVAVGTITAATVGATQAITGVGFAFDSLLIIGAGLTAEGGAAPGRLCIGVVAGTTAADNACLAGTSQDAADPTVTKSYCRRGESLVSFNGSAAIDGRGYVSAKDADGFEITWNANPSDAKLFYFLAIKGGSFSVGDVLTQTDTTTDIVESGLAFQPVAGLLLSAGKAESAAGTLDDHFNISMGAFTSSSAENSQALRDAHNLATSATVGALDYDSSYLNISTSSAALDGEMGITSVDSGGYTARMTNADPAQAFVAHLLFGSAAAGGSNANLMTGKFGGLFAGKL